MLHDLSRWCRRSVVASLSSRATAGPETLVMRVVRQAALVASAREAQRELETLFEADMPAHAAQDDGDAGR